MEPKGLGPIQRQIWRFFIGEPSAELSTADLMRLAYYRVSAGSLRHSHRSSLLRAADSVAVRVGRKRHGLIIWGAKPRSERD